MAHIQLNFPKEPIPCGNWVNAKWTRPSLDGQPIVSPYNGQKIGDVRFSSANDVHEAVLSASEAAKAWAKTPIKERAQVLFRFREILMRDVDKISNQVSIENGKTLAEAKAGLMKGVEVLEFAISLQNMDSGGRMEVSRGVFCEYRRQPLGVVAGITPFNFPAMVPMWMIPNALATGNAFVWKPSEKTPLTSILISEALQEAGLPVGVFTVLQGGKETVEAICDHPGVKAVAFVGSTPAAKAVYLRATSNGKRALALGGAKNHVILLPDSHPDFAAPGVLSSFMGCAGQRCMAASVLLAVGDVERTIEQLKELASKVELPNGMGAIINKESLKRLENAISHAEKDGAKILLDGRGSAPKGYEGGNWLRPTILDHVKPGTQAAKDELFGPVLSIIRCKNLSEALSVAETSHFGNAISVFTNEGAAAEEVIQSSGVGMVGVNVGVPVPREPFSFGGTRESKFGHGDITGESSLDFWSDLKKVTTKWVAQKDQNWMS